ncbi:IMMT [Bugula neritina]|uniref:MICOS complex subunit MIC60 n=1 Tax=Bugula neritina TaxID=10212 RepID=A0A7J7J5U6_BUGNE|nr:IMMT [Bugula neritina]
MDNIAKNIAKVKGLESALEERANLEKVITHVQDLTCSSLCLMHAIAHDVDCVGEEYDIIRIDDPLKRCFLAAEQNPFAQAILHTIPNLAAERGIYTISSLEKRFDRVYAECRKALDGWLTYFFTDPKPRYLNAAEFESAEGMSQTDLVVQAKYFMDKKCMAEAVRCLIQLDGTARSLAQDWIEKLDLCWRSVRLLSALGICQF